MISHCFFMSISKQLKTDSQKRHSRFLFTLLSLSPLLLGTPTVVHAQWEADQRLTFDSEESVTGYNNGWCVAANGDTVQVVWIDRGSFPRLYTKRSVNGGGTWGPDTCLVDTQSYSYDPTVAAAGSFVHVVWDDHRNGNLDIYYKRSTDGGTTWDPSVQITNNSADSRYPSLAVAGLNIHAVWEDFRSGSPTAIYYKRSIDGGTTWGPDTCLSNGPAQSGLPSVAVSGSNVYVVWFDTRDGNMEIYFKRSRDGGTTWDLDTRLTFTPEISWFPCLAVSGSNLHVVWNDWRDGNAEVYYKRSTDGGTTWTPDTNLTQNTSWSGNPTIAVSGSNVHLIFVDERFGYPNNELFYTSSTDGGSTWAPEVRLTNADYASVYPSLIVSGSRLHVVWQDNRDTNGANSEIYYKRNPTGNGVMQGDNPHFLATQDRHGAFPNPFCSYTIISGHEAEEFSLYDASGRKVGVFKGDRIGLGLASGVYFLKPQGQDSKPLRIVKLR